ncbi:MAG: hypothetical protein ABIV47_08230 [Roseiflexaceae bacterium]
MNTIFGVFDDAATARRAVDTLNASSLHLHDVSLVSRDADSTAHGDGDVSAGQGATVGAVWGGLVGLATLFIPGIGPFIAFGMLGAAVTGAVTGAVVGGITAALVDFSGIPEADARGYEELAHTGKTLVAVKAREEDANEVHRILTTAGADSINDSETGTFVSGNQPVVTMYNERGNRLQENLDANPMIHTSLIEDTAAPPGLTNDTVYSSTARGIYDSPASADTEDYGAHPPVPANEHATGQSWAAGDAASGAQDDDLSTSRRDM